MPISAVITRGYTYDVSGIITRGFSINRDISVYPPAPLSARSQQAEVGVFVELFSIDLTSKGGGVFYWSPSRPTTATPIIWQGHSYASFDMEATGFDCTTGGVSPRPRLSISNADSVIGAILIANGDLLGCTVTRTRTLYEYLDDQPGADPEQYWPLDIYRVERKVSQNKRQVTFELAAATDNVGAKIPREVVVRDVCPFVYRRYTGGAFDYTKATCPYTGAASFDRLGKIATSANDSCGKHVSDCKLRFGASSVLPFGGFPGVGRVKL